MPPLSHLAPYSKGNQQRVDDCELAKILRQIAGNFRNTHALDFYSIRHISAHFNTSRHSAGKAIDTLKAEGVLTNCWGSKTRIQPLSINRDLHFRGVIAELVAVPTFDAEPRCRALTQNVFDELWRGGFVPRLWFYEKADAEGPIFCERVIAEKPDSIVWVMPTARTTTLAYRLLNCGIRVIKVMAVLDGITELLG